MASFPALYIFFLPYQKGSLPFFGLNNKLIFKTSQGALSSTRCMGINIGTTFSGSNRKGPSLR